jgi:hypothetical protein
LAAAMFAWPSRRKMLMAELRSDAITPELGHVLSASDDF